MLAESIEDRHIKYEPRGFGGGVESETPDRGRPGWADGLEAGGRDRTDGHLITSEVLYH